MAFNLSAEQIKNMNKLHEIFIYYKKADDTVLSMVNNGLGQDDVNNYFFSYMLIDHTFNIIIDLYKRGFVSKKTMQHRIGEYLANNGSDEDSKILKEKLVDYLVNEYTTFDDVYAPMLNQTITGAEELRRAELLYNIIKESDIKNPILQKAFEQIIVIKHNIKNRY